MEESNNRERFLRTMNYQETDRRPLHLVGVWKDTLARWKREGLPEEVQDVHGYLGVKDMALNVINVTGISGIYPPFEQKVIREDEETVTSIDSYGRTVLNFKHHTSFPEWINFPVKAGADLRTPRGGLLGFDLLLPGFVKF